MVQSPDLGISFRKGCDLRPAARTLGSSEAVGNEARDDRWRLGLGAGEDFFLKGETLLFLKANKVQYKDGGYPLRGHENCRNKEKRRKTLKSPQYLKPLRCLERSCASMSSTAHPGLLFPLDQTLPAEVAISAQRQHPNESHLKGFLGKECSIAILFLERQMA